MKNTGQILRENREKLGLTIHEISLALKINSRIIKAMEEGNTAQLPPRTFLRGFVQSYATYLKLDMDHFMVVFQSEIEPDRPDTSNEPALTIPNSDKKAPAPTWQKMLFWNGSSPKLTSLLIGGFALAIVAAIVLISRTIEKYQNERIVAPTESMQSLEAKKSADPAGDSDADDSRELSSEDAPDPKVADKHSLTPVPVSSLPASATPPSASQSKPETSKIVQVIKPDVPAKPEPKKNETAKHSESDTKAKGSEKSKLAEKAPEKLAEKPVEKIAANAVQKVLEKPVQVAALTPSPLPKPVEKPPVKEKSPERPVEKIAAVEKVAAEKPVEKPKDAPTADKAPASVLPKGAPQELILEAMDKVTVEVEIDGSAPQNFDMSADQIRTVKAKKSLRVKLSDGGAVSLIHNGKDTGVPGNLGKPLSLSYPR